MCVDRDGVGCKPPKSSALQRYLHLIEVVVLPAKRIVFCLLAALHAVETPRTAAAPPPRNVATVTIVPAPATRAAAAPVHLHNTDPS